jgi:hypothetical protein
MNIEELGRRAVACKHFYWMPGMLLSNGRRVGVWTPGEVCGSSETSPQYDGAIHPDLSDPATLGCLLHLVREAWGEQYIEVFAYRTEMHDKRWCIERTGSERDQSLAWYGWTEGEALVAALEAAP